MQRLEAVDVDSLPAGSQELRLANYYLREFQRKGSALGGWPYAPGTASTFQLRPSQTHATHMPHRVSVPRLRDFHSPIPQFPFPGCLLVPTPVVRHGGTTP